MRSLYRILELLIGSKVTIRRGFSSGLHSGVPIAILITVYFVWVKNFGDTYSPIQNINGGGLFVLGYMLLLLSLIFLFVGGRSIGCLFTRPLATVLEKVLPETNKELIWGASNALVWATVSTLVLINSLLNTTRVLEIAFIVCIVFVSFVVGFWGGRKGFVLRDEPRKKNREKELAGGIVTGSLLGLAQTFISNFFTSGEPSTYRPSALLLGLITQITLWSVVSLFLYKIINLLAFVALKFSKVQNFEFIVYISVSTVVWLVLSALVLSVLSDAELNGIITFSIGIGLCGACGGFAMSQFHQDKNHEGEIQ